jgi:hypothetical protein
MENIETSLSTSNISTKGLIHDKKKKEVNLDADNKETVYDPFPSLT